MKKKMLIVASFTCLSFLPAFSVFADVQNLVYEEGASYDVQNVRSGNCHAFTYCPGGYKISCYAYGQGCTWYVQPGEYVTCSGYDYYGQWITSYEYCY